MLSRVVLRCAVQQGRESSSLVNRSQWRSLTRPAISVSSPHFYSSASTKVGHNTKTKQNKKISSVGKQNNKIPIPNKKDTGSGKDLKQIQSMPPRLTKLVTDSKDGGWPTLTNISILASKCHQAGVDMDQVEDFFIRHFRKASKSSEKTEANRENNFFRSTCWRNTILIILCWIAT